MIPKALKVNDEVLCIILVTIISISLRFCYVMLLMYSDHECSFLLDLALIKLHSKNNSHYEFQSNEYCLRELMHMLCFKQQGLKLLLNAYLWISL